MCTAVVPAFDHSADIVVAEPGTTTVTVRGRELPDNRELRIRFQVEVTAPR